MAEVEKTVTKVSSNIKERVGAVGDLMTDEARTVRTAISQLTALRPVKAAAEVTVGTIDNARKFVEKQAEIARRWVG